MLEAVPPYPLKRHVLEATIGEFCEMCEPEYELRILKARRAVVAFGRLRSLRDEIAQVVRYLESVKVAETTDEEAAKRGVNFPTAAEALLVGAMREFHLTALERPKGLRGLFVRSAADVPLAEYLICIKDRCADANYQRRYAAIMEAKSKKGGGR